jgi:hypothetical protein
MMYDGFILNNPTKGKQMSNKDVVNTELSSKMVEILGGIQDAVSKTKDFAVEQLPDIASQYITYGRIDATITFLVALSVTVAAIFVARKCFSLLKKDDENAFAIIGAALSTVGFVISSIITLCNISPMILVWAAPKVWLIKELAHLIGK